MFYNIKLAPKRQGAEDTDNNTKTLVRFVCVSTRILRQGVYAFSITNSNAKSVQN